MRLNQIILSLMLVVSLWVTTSCECNHDIVTPFTSSLQVGNVVCADGTVISATDFSNSGKEPVAIIYHVNQNSEINCLGYAVYIHDMAPQTFADSLGVEQETSASLTDEDGNANTYALYHCEDVFSSMAIKVFDMWSYGQSAFVPSIRQLSYLFPVRYAVNERIKAVGGEPISLEPGDCWLWSSTEVEGQTENKAWLFSMQSGTYQETPKNQAHRFRPIISIYHVE